MIYSPNIVIAFGAPYSMAVDIWKLPATHNSSGNLSGAGTL